MIVVTGEPRSGTSLMMMVVGELGYKIIGKQYVSDNHYSNPEGVWEIPRIAKNGLTMDMAAGKLPSLCKKLVPNVHDTKDYVIKLISYGLTSSDRRLVDKVIICVRNPEEVLVSQHRCGYDTNLLDYTLNQIALMKWLSMTEKPFIVVDYNSFVINPKFHVMDVAGFLEVDDKELMDKAASKVNPSLYRTKV